MAIHLSDESLAEAYRVTRDPVDNSSANGKVGICTECKMPQTYRAGYRGSCLNHGQGCGGVVIIHQVDRDPRPILLADQVRVGPIDAVKVYVDIDDFALQQILQDHHFSKTTEYQLGFGLKLRIV